MLSRTSLLLLVLCASCATAKVITGPDGTQNHLIKCGFGIEHCYEKATEICGTYTIVDHTVEVHGGTGQTGTSSADSMLVKCNQSE